MHLPTFFHLWAFLWPYSWKYKHTAKGFLFVWWRQDSLREARVTLLAWETIYTYKLGCFHFRFCAFRFIFSIVSRVRRMQVDCFSLFLQGDFLITCFSWLCIYFIKLFYLFVNTNQSFCYIKTFDYASISSQSLYILNDIVICTAQTNDEGVMGSIQTAICFAMVRNMNVCLFPKMIFRLLYIYLGWSRAPNYRLWSPASQAAVSHPKLCVDILFR